MIVVDTHIIAYMTFKTAHTEVVQLLHSAVSAWAVPALWRSEFLNVMSIFYKKALLEREELVPALSFAEKLCGGREFYVSNLEILQLVMSSSCSSYDCEYVALAKKMNVPLITYDKQILKEFPTLAFIPEDYLLHAK